MRGRLILAPRPAITALAVLALVAAACTSTAEPGPGVDGTSTTLATVAQPPADAPSRGEGMATLTVEPPVAGPGEDVVVSVPFSGTVEMIGPEGVVSTVVADAGPTTLAVPTDSAPGEYLIVVRADGPGIGVGAIRVATSPGLWIDSDRLTVAADDVVSLRVTSSGLDQATPILIGLGTGWEAELADEAPADDGEAGTGPAGVLSLTESGLLVTGGFEPVALRDLVGRDLFLSGAEADAVQLIALGDDLVFSNLLPIARCDEPVIVSGSIGGPGGVRLVSVSGRHESAAAITDDGEFSVSIPAGSHMLFGWLDGEPPTPLSPVPIDAPCGASIEVGSTATSPSPVVSDALVSDEVFAVKQPACRTLLIDGIVDESGADSLGLTELVAGTLVSRLPMADVVVLSDVDAIVEHVFDATWPIGPGTLVELWGVGERFTGDAYVAGVRHGSGGTVGAYPSTERDATSLVEKEGTAAEWADSFASEVVRGALCIQASPLEAEVGSTAEWKVAVTDLAGEAYRGATVEIAGSQETVTPTLRTVADGPVAFTFTPGANAAMLELTIEAHADAGGQALAAFRTVRAGAGLTYVLMGAYQFEVNADDVPLAGYLGAGITLCASRRAGPYQGVALFQLADYFDLAALGSALMSVVGNAPAGEATLRLNPFDEMLGPANVIGMLFGVQSPTLAASGALLMDQALAFLPAMFSDTDAIVAPIDGAVFRNGRITLLENDGNRVVGVLNPPTGTVTITANGLRLLTATLTAGVGCPIELGG